MMEKRLSQQKQLKTNYIIIIAASLIAAIPLINLRIYGTDDGYVHMLRIFGMEQILKEQNFPPFIYSKFANGFGYAINLFIAQLLHMGHYFLEYLDYTIIHV